MKLMKLRIATGLGLVLFLVTMIGPAGVSQAQAGKGITQASLAGKFAARGSGFFTLCFDASFNLADCASAPPHVVPFNLTDVLNMTFDKAGNSCQVETASLAPGSGSASPATVATFIYVTTTISFDPTTGAGTESFSQYQGGSCSGAVFDSTGATLTATGGNSFVASDSGNRIEFILTTFNAVTSAGSLAGSVEGNVFSATAIRQ